VTCPLCGARRARRVCPGVNQQICSVCCGTKRLVEIKCPSDCPYLSAAREHPAAAVVRQQQRDFSRVGHIMRDLNERQSHLFFLVATFLTQYEPAELQALIDDDVSEAVMAVAGTFETASRGVIYEHRPTSLPAGRLATAIKELLAEAAQPATSAFERDAAVVLRRIEDAAREIRSEQPKEPRALLEVLIRTIKPTAQDSTSVGQTGPEASRLIVP